MAIVSPLSIADRLRRDGWPITCFFCHQASHVDLGHAELTKYIRCPLCGQGWGFDSEALEDLALQLAGVPPEVIEGAGGWGP